MSDETKDFICSVVVNMSGAAIGTVYTKVALAVRWTGSKFRSMAYK